MCALSCGQISLQKFTSYRINYLINFLAVTRYIVRFLLLFCHSPYKKALRQIKIKEYGDIIRLCTDEINMTLTTHLAEALLLRATFYLLRGEMNRAMDDFEQLLSMDSVDKHASSFRTVYDSAD